MPNHFALTEAESKHLLASVPTGKYLPLHITPTRTELDPGDPGAGWALAELLTLRTSRKADDIRKVIAKHVEDALDETVRDADKLSPQDVQSRAHDLVTQITRSLGAAHI